MKNIKNTAQDAEDDTSLRFHTWAIKFSFKRFLPVHCLPIKMLKESNSGNSSNQINSVCHELEIFVVYLSEDDPLASLLL